MSISRDDLFKQAVDESKAQQQKNKDMRSGKFEQKDPIHWSVLPEQGLGLVRIIGNPLVATVPRSKYDPKLVNVVKALCDDDKQGVFYVPSKEEDPGHIYWKIWNLVMAGKWNPNKNAKDYFNAEKYPMIFNRVNKNNRVNQKEEKGMKVNKVMGINSIDYKDYEWHKENKHYALLSKKASISDDGKTVFYEIGVPQELYHTIMNNVVQDYGNWSNYQIAIRRNKIEPYYEVWHAYKDFEKVNNRDKTVSELIVNSAITEEELSWEPYDLDEIFKVSPNKKWFTRLGKFIQQIDVLFNKNYYNELKTLVELEDRAKGETTNIVTENKPVEEPKQNNEVKQQTTIIENPIVNNTTSNATPVTTRTSRPAPVTNTATFNIENYNDKFPFLKEWTPEFKAMVTGFDVNFVYDNEKTHQKDQGIFLYPDIKNNLVDQVPCADCGFLFHPNITVCPRCGAKY
jgi:hypothetical protein